MADVELFPSSSVLLQGLYFVVDMKSMTFLPPFVAQNDDEAKRNFTNLLSYSNSTICRFPEDFRMYKLMNFPVAFTGTHELALKHFEKALSNYELISDASGCVAKDTTKYDALMQKVEGALKTVSNSNNVLVEQIGQVPNLQEEVNKINATILKMQTDIDSLINGDEICVETKKNLIQKLFS